jgi:two-component system sensor histidine kinase KdpD
LPAELLRFARFENVTQIVVGVHEAAIVSELLRRSLPHELVRRTQDIAIHLITREADGAVKPVSRSPRWFRKRLTGNISYTRPWRSVRCCGRSNSDKAYAYSESVDRISSGGAVQRDELRHLAGDTHLCCRFWLTISSLFPRLHTLTVAEPYELLALLIFLVVAMTSAAMAARVREQARVSADRVRATRRLYEFTRRLSGLASSEDVAEGPPARFTSACDGRSLCCWREMKMSC